MRGQAHTLEAVAGAVLLLAGVVFALQSSVVTPLTASTASQHIENQQSAVAEGLLEAAKDNGTLQQAVLYYNNSSTCPEGGFHNTTCPNGGGVPYANGGPPLRFGDSLNETFLDRGIAFNVNVNYVGANGDVRTEQMVYVGRPSDNAVTVRRSFTLFDDDRIYLPNGSKSQMTLNETKRVDSCAAANGDTCRQFYAPDAAPNSTVYNVIQVEVIVWRM